MERERLNQLMQDPSAVQRQDIADLKAMTERYPWFSGAHLLLAVGDHAAGDVFFDEQLRTTAAHLPSRAVLFDLVHTEVEEAAPVRMSVVPPTPLPPSPPILPPVSEIPPPVIAEKVEAPVFAAEPPPEVERPATVALTPVVEEAPVIEEKVEEVIPEVVQPVFAEEEDEEVEVEEEEEVPEIDVVDPVEEEEEEEEVQAPPAEDPLDKQIRNAALAGGYALVLEHTPLPPPTVPKTVPIAATPIPAQPATKPAPVRRDRMRFTDWLHVPEEGAAEPLPAPVAPPVLPSVPTPVAADPAPLRQTQCDIVPAAAPAPPSDTKSLIERFIQQSVQAAPAKKAEFYTPQLAAKRSLEDHSDLVSETLAKVYEAQGNYSKALAAYRRLALKHPDKSTYFAALSKALEAKMSK